MIFIGRDKLRVISYKLQVMSYDFKFSPLAVRQMDHGWRTQGFEMFSRKWHFLMGNGNPSVTGVFIPLWQRGIKGDFKIMLIKSPLAPLFQRGV
jgi:hypothetical protein